MTTARPIRVIKVGGSLFDYPDLVPALHRFVSGQSPAANVLVVGGGAWADAIRDADGIFHIGEAAAHELCLRAMGVTARLLAALVPQWPLETSWEDVRSWASCADSLDDVRIFEVQNFLAKFEPTLPGNAIPHDWTATSDSIGARVAHALDNAEIVLLKSAEVTREWSVEDASRAGYVDRFFHRAARGLPRLACVNLRDPLQQEHVWYTC
jgi:aspartokinase-like uncharacterized kinase